MPRRGDSREVDMRDGTLGKRRKLPRDFHATHHIRVPVSCVQYFELSPPGIDFLRAGRRAGNSIVSTRMDVLRYACYCIRSVFTYYVLAHGVVKQLFPEISVIFHLHLVVGE